MRRIRLAGLFGLALLSPLCAADPVPTAFQNGDVVCFIGDSITHSPKFHSYIYLYYLTHFPERQIKFVNAGIAGDSAGGAVSRLEWDIFPHKPNVVSIMLGMNDVNRGLYGKEKPDQNNLKQREAALNNHKQNMIKLATLLKERLNPRFIFCTPSPYDQTLVNNTPNLFGVNDALVKCGEYARELAASLGGGIVDFNGPMTEINQARQKIRSTWTIIGPDRVHPGDAGHLVMAYLYLAAQKVPAPVSTIAIADGQATKADNATVTEVKQSPEQVSFTATEKSLPFPVEASAKEALQLMPVEADLDEQTFSAKVAPGTWKLRIDDQAVGEFDAADLAKGVNLAENEKTPQYQQANEVAKVNEQRRQLAVRIRTAAQIKMMLLHAKVNVDDPAAVNAYLDGFLTKLGPNSPMKGYFTYQFKVYRETAPKLAEVWAQIDQLVAKCYQLNQPRPHRWVLSK